MSDDDIILSDPHILGGTACIRGTRLSVYAIAARYKGGEPVEEILDGYPDLGREAVEAAVRYAEKHPFREHPDARPWRKAVAKKVVA